ncbi:MAG: 5-(carboxyamino)imidazole ribonucleotide synthase [Cyanobium sp.]|nr:5-(carboxyamino)imidazole ribonucleotide synthase [Cyanobium sp.]
MTQSPSAARPLSRQPIGVVGGGQLAWMLAAAARELDLPVRVQTPAPDDPATRLAAAVVEAPLNDVAATRRLAASCSAVTFENEWIDLEGLAGLAAEGVVFLPSLESLEPLVNKHGQRRLLQRLGLPSPPWRLLADLLPQRLGSVAGGEGDEGAEGPSASSASVQAGAAVPAPVPPVPVLPPGWRFPLMAKAASGGYDGRGTRVLRDAADLEQLVAAVDPRQWIVETYVHFEQELSQLACRDREGNVFCYPLVQTHQHHQVCDWVLAPAAVSHAVQAFARNVAVSLLTAIDYVGVLSIELFYGADGVLVNEIAPRTHNSGHVTIEASRTSQFSQQARIVAGLPMGPVDLLVPGALMVNLLGFDEGSAEVDGDLHADLCARLRVLPGATLHWYGKRQSSPGRKLGHLTLVLEQADAVARQAEAMARLAEVRSIWPLPWPGSAAEAHPA